MDWLALTLRTSLIYDTGVSMIDVRYTTVYCSMDYVWLSVAPKKGPNVATDVDCWSLGPPGQSLKVLISSCGGTPFKNVPESY